jgi:hypothetical protein
VCRRNECLSLRVRVEAEPSDVEALAALGEPRARELAEAPLFAGVLALGEALRAAERVLAEGLLELREAPAREQRALVEVRHIRAQVWSAGKYPNGITPESLTRAHLSVQRNPIIAEVFHRVGLIEKCGRGTNRVADMCRPAGIAPPEFEEITGAAVVTFRGRWRWLGRGDPRSKSRRVAARVAARVGRRQQG